MGTLSRHSSAKNTHTVDEKSLACLYIYTIQTASTAPSLLSVSQTDQIRYYHSPTYSPHPDASLSSVLHSLHPPSFHACLSQSYGTPPVSSGPARSPCLRESRRCSPQGSEPLSGCVREEGPLRRTVRRVGMSWFEACLRLRPELA